MSGMQPFAQLIGPADIYIAPYGTAIPAIDAVPSGNWVKLGTTDGDQTTRMVKETNYWSDNDGLGDVTARNINAGSEAEFTVVSMTYEAIARILHAVGNITTTTSGSTNVKEMGFEAEYIPTEYALLLRGPADSPYGRYVGQNFIPRGVFDGDIEQTKGKETRAEVECLFHGLRDDTQPAGKKFGWGQAQIS
ncbi:MAG: hypothetical protein LCH85_22215 [Chloroflexi bacterium]|nr:hypothetical protein [Chloroflexota bacterium]